MNWNKTKTLFPGMLLKLEDGTIRLVGDVNDSGGRCSCCYDSKRNIVAWAFLPGFEPRPIEEDPYGVDEEEEEEDES